MKNASYIQHHSTAVRFLALVAMVLLTARQCALSRVAGTTSPLIRYLPAIILCAWLGGLFGVYFFVAPYYTLQHADPTVLAQLLDFLLVGALIATDPVGRVTFMNPVAEFLTGWSQEEAADR